jgi:hypothetical protein
MTPKEKALDIYQMMVFAIVGVYPNFDYKGAKQCALIAVDEMLEFTKQTVVSSLTIWTEEGHFRDETTIYNSYLLEVKQEIEKL